MDCRTESIFLFSMVGHGLWTTALNECAGSYQINFINKKWVWDGYLITLRHRLFIQSFIHNRFDFIFVKKNLLCFIYIFIYIYSAQRKWVHPLWKVTF